MWSNTHLPSLYITGSMFENVFPSMLASDTNHFFIAFVPAFTPRAYSKHQFRSIHLENPNPQICLIFWISILVNPPCIVGHETIQSCKQDCFAYIASFPYEIVVNNIHGIELLLIWHLSSGQNHHVQLEGVSETVKPMEKKYALLQTWNFGPRIPSDCPILMELIIYFTCLVYLYVFFHIQNRDFPRLLIIQPGFCFPVI